MVYSVLQVLETDKLPQQACLDCLLQLENAHKLKMVAAVADVTLWLRFGNTSEVSPRRLIMCCEIDKHLACQSKGGLNQNQYKN